MSAAVAAVRVAPPPRRRVTVAVMLIVAVAVLALGIMHVYRRHQLVRLGYELSRETEKLRALQEDNRRLRLERAMLRHPDRIERYAESLGMTRPDPEKIRVVRAPATQLAEARRARR